MLPNSVSCCRAEHHIIEDREEYSSMVGSHVLALLFIISQIKP